MPANTAQGATSRAALKTFIIKAKINGHTRFLCKLAATSCIASQAVMDSIPDGTAFSTAVHPAFSTGGAA